MDKCDATDTTISDLMGAVIDYEEGNLDDAEVDVLFQGLVDTGLAWTLQGSYGRMAKALINAGRIKAAP